MTYITYNKPKIFIRDYLEILHSLFFFSDFIDYLSNFLPRKYILFTFSCRTALYSYYKSVYKTGEVIVSPLSCKVALIPIIAAGLRPRFVDIDPLTYNIDPEKIVENINSKTIGIQLIHLGGNPCDINEIIKIAKDEDLITVEDCAQAFGSQYMNRNVGTFSNVSCYSLPKAFFGIGGLLTTDDFNLFDRARKINDSYNLMPGKYLLYMLAKNFLESKRSNLIGYHLYDVFMKIRQKRISLINEDLSDLQKYLIKINEKTVNVNYTYFKKFDFVNIKRRENSNKLIDYVNNDSISFAYTRDECKNSYNRIYFTTPIHTTEAVKKLHKNKIEAKHLSQSYIFNFQKNLNCDEMFKKYVNKNKLKNYNDINERIVSLSLDPYISNKLFSYLTETLNDLTF